jgi:signal transduction histidine kinase
VQATEIVMRCDRIRVEQALVNLVENALRHGSGTVTLSAALHGGEVEVHVVDEGPGFADGIVDTALERFTRGDAARRAGGAGLGLAIVKAIIEAHGGTVALAHDEGGGADVVLLLPHARPVAPNARDAAPAGAVAG